jgi:hypothetical protein
MEIVFPPLINFQTSVILKSAIAPFASKDLIEFTVIFRPSSDHLAADFSLGVPT